MRAAARRGLALGASLLVTAAVARAAPPSPAPSASPAASATPAPPLRDLLDARSATYPGSGVVVAYAGPQGTTVTVSGSGGTDRPLDERSLFEIGSVTKTFTATLLATMVLDRTVRLDDPIAKYVPANVRVPTHGGKAITLLNLAEQNSGLPRLPANLGNDRVDPYARYRVADMYAFLSHYSLTRDPGAKFEYSNYGVALLGQLLANRLKTTYADALQRRVLRPLGMNDTTLVLTSGQRARFTAGLDADGNTVAPWTFDAIAPAGALHSSLADLEKFVDCNLGRGPLAAACRFAQEPRATMPGGRIGLVWWTDDRDHVTHHGGDTAGYHAGIALSADRTRAAIVLADGGGPADALAMHVLDPAIPVRLPPAPLTLDAATLDAYTGTYGNAQTGLKFTVARKDAALTVQLTGQDASRIYPVAFDQFVSRVVDARFKFTRDSDGKPSSLTIAQNGQVLTFVRPGAATPAPADAQMFPAVANLDAATLDSYVGQYVADVGTFYVTRSKDGIIVRLSGQGAAPVYPSAKDAFYYRIVDAQIDFRRDASGNVVELILHQNGADVRAPRKPSP